jgi:hypothetical protein
MWISQAFSNAWAGEFDTAFRSSPPSAWGLQRGSQLLGFACYDVTARGFFGPAAVLESQRGKDLGHLLLLASLHAFQQRRLRLRHHWQPRADRLLPEPAACHGDPG